MRVVFRQSGGIAGLVRGCTLDTSTGPTALRRELTEMLEASGLLRTGAPGKAVRTRGTRPKSPGPARDLVQYEITIEPDAEETAKGLRAKSASYDDATLPEQARPLLRWLKGRAKPQQP
jgi:hypothetical protein